MNKKHHTPSLKLALICCASTALVASVSAQTPSSSPSRSSDSTRNSSGTSGSNSSRSATGTSSTAASASSSTNLDRHDRDFITKAALAGHEEVWLSQLALSKTTNSQVRDYAQMIVNDHEANNSRLMAIADSKGISLAGLQNPMSPTGASTRMGSGSYSSGTSSSSSPSTGSAASGTTGRSGGTSATGTGTTSGTGTGSANTSSSDRMTSGTGTSTGRSTSTDSTGTGTGGAYDHNRTAMNSTNGAMSEDISNGLEKIEKKESKLAEKSGADFDRAYIDMMADGHEHVIDLFQSEAKRDNADSQLVAYANETLPKLREHEQKAKDLKKTLR